MKLDLKHLAPYLPYGLKVQYKGIVNGEQISKYKKLEPKNNMSSKEEIDEYDKWVKGYPKDIIGEKISKIKGIKFFNNYITIHVGKNFNYSKTVFCSQIKPILRPLDLAKEIEINGEKIIPIIELAKIHGMDVDGAEILSDKNAIAIYGAVYSNADYKDLSLRNFFGFDLKSCAFDCGVMIINPTLDLPIDVENYVVEKQRVLFQKLLEWHFDLDNLIPQGLAVDINTLND